MLNLQAAGHVRHQPDAHGGVLILDTDAGLWLALNPTAGDFWRSWQSGTGFEESVAQVAAWYPEVPLESIRDDAERLVRDLFARGLIEAIPRGALAGNATDMAEPRAAVPGPRPGWHRVVVALIALVIADVLVRCSFRRSFALVRVSRRSWCRRAATPRQAAIAVTAVSRAARCYPGRAACLEQSLAAVLLSAVRRRRLDWCLGSSSDPYRFHAWVEAGGQPVGSQFDYVRVLAA
jgi:Transglutaminase-like superfamily/Coenzyme PQQ synthesis protein D (PqqD)